MSETSPCQHGLFLVRDHDDPHPRQSDICWCGHDRGWHSGCPDSTGRCNGECPCKGFITDAGPHTVEDIAAMSDEDRHQWYSERYCIYCGSKRRHLNDRCYCSNDE